MINIQELKERIKRKIDVLSEDKLNDVSQYLETIEIGSGKKNILSFAGSLNDLDDEVYNDLTENLEARRKNTRSRLLE